MHRAVERKTAVSGRRLSIRGSLLYLIFYRLVKYIVDSILPFRHKIDLPNIPCFSDRIVYNNAMTSIQNVAEYYDELYPVTAEQKDFYARIGKNYPAPVRFLQIGCGTGSLEHVLVKDGADVTGIEVSKDLIEIATLRRRTQLMPIRFFQLSTLDMKRFLGKNFYNVISCLNSRIAFIKDKTLLKKFFSDCKALLSEGGTLVLHLYNFSTVLKSGTTALPCRSSIRVKLSSSISAGKDDRFFLNQTLETGNGTILPVMQNEELYPLVKDEIILFAREAGFTDFSFYGSYGMDEFNEADNELVCLIR